MPGGVDSGDEVVDDNGAGEINSAVDIKVRLDAQAVEGFTIGSGIPLPVVFWSEVEGIIIALDLLSLIIFGLAGVIADIDIELVIFTVRIDAGVVEGIGAVIGLQAFPIGSEGEQSSPERGFQTEEGQGGILSSLRILSPSGDEERFQEGFSVSGGFRLAAGDLV